MNQIKIQFTLKALLLFFVSALMLSCDSSGVNPDNERNGENEILEIRYGTSFGFCVGYCVRKVEITQDRLIFTKSGSGQSFAPISCTQTYDPQNFTLLTEKVDIREFFDLDEIIGCPDCADGGAEWIELNTGSLKHRITFEYMKEPEEVKVYIGELRLTFEEFNDCN